MNREGYASNLRTLDTSASILPKYATGSALFCLPPAVSVFCMSDSEMPVTTQPAEYDSSYPRDHFPLSTTGARKKKLCFPPANSRVKASIEHLTVLQAFYGPRLKSKLTPNFKQPAVFKKHLFLLQGHRSLGLMSSAFWEVLSG